MPFPQAAVAQFKFLRLPLPFMLHSLEYITFPNWVFLVAPKTPIFLVVLVVLVVLFTNFLVVLDDHVSLLRSRRVG